MGELTDALKEFFSELKDVPKEFIADLVGEQAVIPQLREMLEPWTVDKVLTVMKAGEHLYPLYDEEIKADWRNRAAPYRRYADKFPRQVLFQWFEGARPDLAQAIMRQPKGWQWIVEELELIIKDIIGD